jgi:hypothetical protein
MSAPGPLSALQRRGLLRVGDVLIPGDQDFPSFSRSGCAQQAERMFDFMHEEDRSGVQTLLAAFALLPRVLIRGLMALTERHRAFPAPIGAVLRLINTGVKGVVMTLYYSDVGVGASVYQLIGYDAKVVERPAPAGEET